MWAVLKAKFSPRSHMAEQLLMTGDAYLLEHNSKSGRDFLWSDNQDGEGQNWLGLQLMLLRDELRRLKGGSTNWTTYIQNDCRMNLSTGPSRDEVNERWQATVRRSTTAINEKIVPGNHTRSRDVSAQQQQQQHQFDTWRGNLPQTFGRLKGVLESAWVEASGTILMPQSAWDSKDGVFLRGLIAEYEQLMGAAWLSNIAQGQQGFGDFKKLPVYGRRADGTYDKRVNELLSGSGGNEMLPDYLLTLRKYHQSVQKDRLVCKGNAHISLDQFNQLCRVDLNAVFPGNYNLWPEDRRKLSRNLSSPAASYGLQPATQDTRGKGGLIRAGSVPRQGRKGGKDSGKGATPQEEARGRDLTKGGKGNRRSNSSGVAGRRSATGHASARKGKGRKGGSGEDSRDPA